MRSALILVVPSLAPTLGVVAANPVGITHIGRLFLLSLASWMAGLFLCWLLVNQGRREESVVYATFAVQTSFWFGGTLVRRLGDLRGLSLGLLLTVVTIAIFIRFKDSVVPEVIVFSSCAILLAGPIANGYESVTSFGESTVDEPTEMVSIMTSRPDIWLVVFDGYPGLRALELDYPDNVSRQQRALMVSHGYGAPESVWTSHWVTHWALPSLLNMGYPSRQADESSASVCDLYRMVAGKNRLVDLLSKNGYETYMVESGWSGSSCGHWYDHCIASPWLDEAMYFMVADSLIGRPLFQREGYAFNVGAKASMDWALENADSLSRDDESTFAFVHIVAPHPPFLFDPHCDTTVEPSRFGVTFNRTGVPESVRAAHLQESMLCLNSFMADLKSRIGDDAVVVFTSDHGTDRRDQLIVDPEDWGSAARLERMNAFLAVSSSACDVGDPVVFPNVMRRALSCFTTDGIPDVGTRLFIGPGYELPSRSVQDLIAVP